MGAMLRERNFDCVLCVVTLCGIRFFCENEGDRGRSAVERGRRPLGVAMMISTMSTWRLYETNSVATRPGTSSWTLYEGAVPRLSPPAQKRAASHTLHGGSFPVSIPSRKSWISIWPDPCPLGRPTNSLGIRWSGRFAGPSGDITARMLVTLLDRTRRSRGISPG